MGQGVPSAPLRHVRAHARLWAEAEQMKSAPRREREA